MTRSAPPPCASSRTPSKINPLLSVRSSTPAEEQQALATMIKQRRDSIEQFTKGNRPELAAAEAAEIVVIEEFLPKALDEAALAVLVAEAVTEVAASTGQKPTPKEMGRS